MSHRIPHLREASPGGCLLVASPFVRDPARRGQVILLVQNGTDGAVGVMLDGRFRESIEQVRQSLSALNADAPQVAEVALPLHGVRWSPGQLERELADGTWMTLPATVDRVFQMQGRWAPLVREAGRDVLRSAMGIDQFPRDAALN